MSDPLPYEDMSTLRDMRISMQWGCRTQGELHPAALFEGHGLQYYGTVICEGVRAEKSRTAVYGHGSPLGARCAALGRSIIVG